MELPESTPVGTAISDALIDMLTGFKSMSEINIPGKSFLAELDGDKVMFKITKTIENSQVTFEFALKFIPTPEPKYELCVV